MSLAFSDSSFGAVKVGEIGVDEEEEALIEVKMSFFPVSFRECEVRKEKWEFEGERIGINDRKAKRWRLGAEAPYVITDGIAAEQKPELPAGKRSVCIVESFECQNNRCKADRRELLFPSIG